MILVDRRGEDFPSTTNDNFTLGNFIMEKLDFLLRHETEFPATMEKLDKEKYLSYFFPFDKIDFRKMGVESSWSTDSVEMIALIMTMKNKPQAVMMSFQKEYAEPYEWLVEVFRDWSNHIRGLHIHVLHHDHVHDDYISRLDCMVSIYICLHCFICLSRYST